MQRANAAGWPRRLEIAALVLIACLPLVPYLAVIFAGVGRFQMAADLALEEFLTRHAWHGETLLGMPSRFHWAHPGPLFFYVNAPFVELFGQASTGLFVGVAVLAIAEVAFVVAPLRVSAGRAHALAAVVVMLVWFAAFGNVATHPWTRMTNTLPLVTFMVCSAIFALGHPRAAIPAVFFGALATETHISTIPLVFIVLAGALAVYVGGHFFPKRRRPTRPDLIALGAAIALGLLVSWPPLLEQLRAGGPNGDGVGNIRELTHFFAHRTEPYKSFHDTFVLFVNVNAWLPDRAFTARILEEGTLPYPLRWDPIVIHMTPTAIAWGVFQLLAIGGAVYVAWRRRDGISLALLAVGLFAAATTFYGISGIIGEIHPSLVYWATAPTTVLWIGTVSAFLAAVEAHLKRGAMAAGVLVSLLVTIEQRSWLKGSPTPPGAFPVEALAADRMLYEELRKAEERDHFTPVIHVGYSEWPVMHLLLLEHEKDGVDIRIAAESQWAYPPGRPEAGAVNPRQLWVFAREHESDVWFARCLEPVATVGNLRVLAADEDPPKCPPPSRP